MAIFVFCVCVFEHARQNDSIGGLNLVLFICCLCCVHGNYENCKKNMTFNRIILLNETVFAQHFLLLSNTVNAMIGNTPSWLQSCVSATFEQKFHGRCRK